jgi:hypothetical protein
MSVVTTSQPGDSEITAAVTQSISLWRFTPAVRNGDPIDAEILLEMNFRRAP